VIGEKLNLYQIIGTWFGPLFSYWGFKHEKNEYFQTSIVGEMVGQLVLNRISFGDIYGASGPHIWLGGLMCVISGVIQGWAG
jgi:hypothetical protein